MIFNKKNFNINIIVFVFSCSDNDIDKKVDAILSQMTMDEKIGQMTQLDRRFFRTEDDIIKFGIGSILSGGGSVHEDNSIKGWADMYDRFQSLAQKTRLKNSINLWY